MSENGGEAGKLNGHAVEDKPSNGDVTVTNGGSTIKLDMSGRCHAYLSFIISELKITDNYLCPSIYSCWMLL